MRLSERQTQLCRWALEGLPEKALARELGMSKAGVHYDFKALYIQFDVHDRAELVVSIVRQVKGAHGFGYCD
ncbi:MAG: helix-turn-helix transcriptional regulator [Phycisphaerales bacterium]